MNTLKVGVVTLLLLLVALVMTGHDTGAGAVISTVRDAGSALLDVLGKLFR